MAKRGTLKQPIYERIYRAAEGNWRAAEVLYAHLYKGEHYVIFSYGMITGLAIELYLKAIIHIEGRGRDIRGKRGRSPHSWAELYEMVSQESKVSIRDYFNSVAPKYGPVALPESVPDEVRALAKDRVVTYDFDGTISAMGEAFDDFRYAFEDPFCLVCSATAPTMRYAIRKRILELAPRLGKH